MNITRSEIPLFHIGEIPVHGRLILAPMDGISDPPFRLITRRLGSALTYSEFINTLDYATKKHYYQHRLEFTKEERPFGVQLLDNDPLRMAASAQKIASEVKPDFFDLNLGCCARTVTSRGAGSALMRTPTLLKDILKALKEVITIPLTAKMRLGWDEDDLNYRDIADILVENGVSLLALHGRTVRMGYFGEARWQPIAELKAALSIPVIGNGDVRSPQDALRMINETGCDAVMIGRGAMANPWIFSGRDRADVDPIEVQALMHEQLTDMLASYDNGALMAFRKFAKAYLAPYAFPREIIRNLLTRNDVDEFLNILDHLFESLANQDQSQPDQ